MDFGKIVIKSLLHNNHIIFSKIITEIFETFYATFKICYYFLIGLSKIGVKKKSKRFLLKFLTFNVIARFYLW